MLQMGHITLQHLAHYIRGGLRQRMPVITAKNGKDARIAVRENENLQRLSVMPYTIDRVFDGLL